MPTGFTPKYSEKFPLNDLNREEFLAITAELAKRMKWAAIYLGDKGFVAHTNNGIFSWNAEIRVTFENDMVNLVCSSEGGEAIDDGKTKRTIDHFIVLFNEIRQLLTRAELRERAEALKEHYVSSPGDEEKLTDQPSGTKPNFFFFLKPTKGYFITPVLVYINAFIFLLMAVTGVSIFEPDNESLLTWGANFRPMTLDGEWWRLITSCFLHIGILHLVMNMYALVYIGLLLEPHLGKARFLSAYLLTGITASIASLWWHDLTISAGASGAIFGMYGVFLAMLTTNLIEKNARKSMLSSIGIFVVYNLAFGMTGAIDNAGHIGGLLGGILIGYAFIPGLRNPDANKIATIGALGVLVFALAFVALKRIPNDIGTYDSKMNEFSKTESSALAFYNLPDSTPKQQLLYALKEEGINSWAKNLQLIDEVEKLDLPEEFHQRNQTLKEYCKIRMKTFEFMYKAVQEDTDKYKEEVTHYNKQIDSLLNDLSDKPKK